MIDAQGNWRFTFNDVDRLQEGEIFDLSVAITAVDGTLGSIDITVIGTEDLSVISFAEITNPTVSEDAVGIGTFETFVGSVGVNDPDFQQRTLSLPNPIGTFGTLSIDFNALVSGGPAFYNPGPAAQALNAGETAEDSFLLVADDGVTATLTVTVIGANDEAIVSGNLTGSGDEDVGTLTGTAVVMDIDAGQSEFIAATEAGAFGSFSIDAQGAWVYALDEFAQTLIAGQTAEDSFTITTVDGTTETVAVTITGANDAAVISGELTGTIDEDATTPLVGLLTIIDIDSGEAQFVPQSQITGTFGTFTLDAGGGWIYDVDNTLVQDLNAGETAIDSFVVESADGSSTQTVVITITGSDEVAAADIELVDGVITITGGQGDDVIDVTVNGDGLIEVTGTLGTTTFDPADVDSFFIDLGDGDDVIRLTNDVTIDAVINGGAGDDFIAGGGGNDTIRGGDGNDNIRGRLGNDIVIGGDGEDILRGNRGRDLLLGGDQADRLIGGGGDDIVIGGLTNFADDDVILELIREEWGRTDIGAFGRAINVIFGGGTLAGSGFRLLPGEAIFSDGFDDDLDEDDPGLDLFL